MADSTPIIQILRKPPETAPAAEQAPASPAPSWPAVADRLRQYAAAREQRSAAERCELCGVDIDPQHGHVVDLPRRALQCVCRPCYLLFAHEGAGGSRFRAVPERFQLLPGFADAREDWEALQIPIGLAFFFRNSETGRTTGFYPSPAGATESELPLEAWDNLTRTLPPLATLAPDVEALLVRRRDTGAAILVDALIVPIDVCYELVGRIRLSWRGFHGGDEVWEEIDGVFARATERARESAG